MLPNSTLTLWTLAWWTSVAQAGRFCPFEIADRVLEQKHALELVARARGPYIRAAQIAEPEPSAVTATRDRLLIEVERQTRAAMRELELKPAHPLEENIRAQVLDSVIVRQRDGIVANLSAVADGKSTDLVVLRDARELLRSLNASNPEQPPLESLAGQGLRVEAATLKRKLLAIDNEVLIPAVRARVLLLAAPKYNILRTYGRVRTRLGDLGVPDSIAESVVLTVRDPATAEHTTYIGSFIETADGKLSLKDSRTQQVVAIDRTQVTDIFPGRALLPEGGIGFPLRDSLMSDAPLWYARAGAKYPPERLIAVDIDSYSQPTALMEVLGRPYGYERVPLHTVSQGRDWIAHGVTEDQGHPALSPKFELHRAMQALPRKLTTGVRASDRRRIENMLTEIFALSRARNAEQAQKIAEIKFGALRRLYRPGVEGTAQFWRDYQSGLFGLELEAGAGDFDGWATPAFRAYCDSLRR